MRTRERIDLSDSPMDVLLKLAEGNPGAATALGNLMKDGSEGIILALHLDDMGMRGEQIWVAFNDYCKRDLIAFCEAIKNRDKGMVAMVNQRCPTKQAVCYGAS